MVDAIWNKIRFQNCELHEITLAVNEYSTHPIHLGLEGSEGDSSVTLGAEEAEEVAVKLLEMAREVRRSGRRE